MARHLCLRLAAVATALIVAWTTTAAAATKYEYHGTIYKVIPNGDLIWQQIDVTPVGGTGSIGNVVWSKEKKVGNGWGDFAQIIAAGNNNIYALKRDGELLWYKHKGYQTGTFSWEGPKVVGTGWNGFRSIFPGGNGIVYAINSAGTLLWYRHNAWNTGGGAGTWEGPKPVGSEWDQFKQVFSTGGGDIYAVKQDDTMVYYHHDGHTTGAANFTGPILYSGTPWWFRYPVSAEGFVMAGQGAFLAIYPPSEYKQSAVIIAKPSGGQPRSDDDLITFTGLYDWSPGKVIAAFPVLGSPLTTPNNATNVFTPEP